MTDFPGAGDEYRIELYHGDGEVAAAVRRAWVEEAGLDPAEAERRLAEVFAVAHHTRDGLAGICTVYAQRIPQLRLPLWHYRAFVMPAHRTGYLGANLGLAARLELERRFVAGEDRTCCGLAMEVENAELRTAFPQGRWYYKGFEMSFIGINARGDHVRVLYFPGAEAPLPGS